jgi:hypothetical protein
MKNQKSKNFSKHHKFVFWHGLRVPNRKSGQLFSHIKGRYINLSNVVTNFMMKINIMLAIYSKYDPFPSA